MCKYQDTFHFPKQTSPLHLYPQVPATGRLNRLSLLSSSAQRESKQLPFHSILGQQHSNPSHFLLRSHLVTYIVDFNLLFQVELHDALDTFKYRCMYLYDKRCCGRIGSAFGFRYCQSKCFKRMKPWKQFYDLLS